MTKLLHDIPPLMGLRSWFHDFPDKSKMANGNHIEFRKMLISPYTRWRYLHAISYNDARRADYGKQLQDNFQPTM